MSENTVLETTDEIVIAEYFTAETYSPYGVIKHVNKVLKDLGIDKVLPGPMGYTYCKKGYIATIDTEKKVVTREAAIEWTEKYVGRLAAKMVLMSEKETEEVEETTEETE